MAERCGTGEDDIRGRKENERARRMDMVFGVFLLFSDRPVLGREMGRSLHTLFCTMYYAMHLF